MDSKTAAIIGVVALCILILLTIAFHQTVFPKQKDRRVVIRSITADAMVMAIILLMTFVPTLGFIQVTPLISFTLVHLPVLLGAAIGGWKKGLLFGFVFGVSSYINAFGTTGLNLLFAQPWIAIPPRVLFGLFAGIAFSLLGKLSKWHSKVLYLALVAGLCTVIHTVLVFANLAIYYPDVIVGYFTSSDPVAAGTSLTFTVIIAIGMAGETAIAALLIPPVVAALQKAVPSLWKR